MPEKVIPYGRHSIDDADIAAVIEVLRGDWLTTGPAVGRFEESFAAYVNASHAVAVSNGTAALHLCALAAKIQPDDEVIVPALTFAASANGMRYAGAKVVFADVRPDTLTIDVAHAASLITKRTRAIVCVDYAGLPCDLQELSALAQKHGLLLIEDACHAPGAEYQDRKIGSLAHLSVFSFHPVKHMTTGEGGMITTNDPQLAKRLRLLRNHGIATDHRQREQLGTWRYDMTELGYNYRLCDIQCALGASQLKKMPRWLERRRTLAAQYEQAFAELPWLTLQTEPSDRRHAWHLYPVRLVADRLTEVRQEVFAELRNIGIGVNVHYLPVYLHSYYRELGYPAGLCPVAEKAYDGLLSLPMYHGLSDADQQTTIKGLMSAVKRHV